MLQHDKVGKLRVERDANLPLNPTNSSYLSCIA